MTEFQQKFNLNDEKQEEKNIQADDPNIKLLKIVNSYLSQPQFNSNIFIEFNDDAHINAEPNIILGNTMELSI